MTRHYSISTDVAYMHIVFSNAQLHIDSLAVISVFWMTGTDKIQTNIRKACGGILPCVYSLSTPV